MGFCELMLLAVGLSMDAFAVSICKGLSMTTATPRAQLTCGAWFGSFQALMPLAGFYLGSLFAEAISSIDHWVAFGLLVIIGANMLRDAFSEEEEACGGDLRMGTMFLMAVATSIDALAVGISLAITGEHHILATVSLIGMVTFFMSAAGVKVGNLFGSRFQQKAQIAGGIILILLGCKILMEHLEVV